MVAPTRRQHLILPLAPLVAGVAGALTAALCVLLPTALLEAAVVDSGVAAVLSAAEPPLGLTARAVLALLCGGGVALVTWFAAFLAVGTRSVVLQRSGAVADAAPVVRRADAHPDAPPRRPVFANRDLGMPFLDVRAKGVEPTVVSEDRALPDDLDQRLAAYDPGALPDAPADWFPPPARLMAVPREPRLARGERLETFALPPPPPPTARATPLREDPAVTVQSLIERLERSVARREPEPPPVPEPQRETIEDTLSTLRKLATRGA